MAENAPPSTNRTRERVTGENDDSNNSRDPSSEAPNNSAEYRFTVLRKLLEDAFWKFLRGRNLSQEEQDQIVTRAKNLLSNQRNNLRFYVDCVKFKSEIEDFRQHKNNPVGTLIDLCSRSKKDLAYLILILRPEREMPDALKDQLQDIILEASKNIFSQLSQSRGVFGVFPNVYIASRLDFRIQTRHVRLKHFFQFVVASPNGNDCAAAAKLAHPLPADDDERRVLVIGGASGSGKTLYSFACAHNDDDGENIIIYLIANDIVDAGWNEPNWEAQSQVSDKKPRDTAASYCVRKAISDLLFSFKIPDVHLSPDGTLNKVDRQRKLVVIIDEIGPTPNLLRALCSIGADLSAFLHTKYLDVAGGNTTKILSQKGTTTFSNRVCFIAAGTGVDCASDLASNPNRTANFKFLDESEADLFSALLDYYFRNSNPNLHARLRRLCPSPASASTTTSIVVNSSSSASSSLSTVERLAADLVKNRRAAALFLRLLMDQPDYHTQLVTSHQQLFEQRLMSLMTEVVIEFMSLNGLSKFRKPLNVLVASVAVAAHRVDVSKLKKDNLSDEAQAFMKKFFAPIDSESSSIQVDDLHSILCTTGGVLVSCRSTSSSAQLDPSRRFLVSPSHAAMTRILLGVPTRDASWSGFELGCADYCLMLACASQFCHHVLGVTPTRENDADVEELTNDDDAVPDCTTTAASTTSDKCQKQPSEKLCCDRQAMILERLREWLIFGGTAVGVEMLQMQECVIGAEEQADLQEELKARLQALIRRRFAVVLMFAPLEPFADFAVFGPDGSIILIQCKYLQSKIEFDVEFAKMGFGYNNNNTDNDASDFVDFLSRTVAEVTNNNVRVRAAIMCECAEQSNLLNKQFVDFKESRKNSAAAGVKRHDIDFFCWTRKQSKTVLYPTAATAMAAEHHSRDQEQQSYICSAACFSSDVKGKLASF